MRPSCTSQTSSSSSSSSRRRFAYWTATVLMVMACILPHADAFTSSSMQMTYKPPVQSSVSKIRSNRLSSQQRPQSSKQQAATAAASNLNVPSPPTTSFEDRMRGLVFGRRNKQEQQQQHQRQLPPNVCTVETLQEYKRVVGDESSKLVCVRFFAPWCRACKAVQPLFYHMANKFPNVIFVDVPVTEKNANLHQGLGVPSLPYGHIYHPTSGLVEELRMSKRCIPRMAMKLQSYVNERCDLIEVGDVTCPYKPLDDEEGGVSSS